MTIIPANTTNALAQCKLAAPGDVVELAAGTYPLLNLRTVVKAAPGVTVRPADGASVVLQGLAGSSTEGFNFEGFGVSLDARTAMCANFANSARINFQGVRFAGLEGAKPRGYQQASVTDPTKMVSTILLNLRTCTDVVVEGCALYYGTIGVQHQNCTNLTVQENDFHDIGLDGVRGGGTSQMEVVDNTFTDFWPLPGWHSDAIQFWTVNTTTPTTDLTITGNIYRQGSGAAIQGCFLGNEANIPFENVTITGNAFEGCIYHGIYVSMAVNPLVQDNFVTAFLGTLDGAGNAVTYSQVILRESASGRLWDNWAQKITTYLCTGPIDVAGNIIMAQPAAGDHSDLDAWLARHDPPPVLTLEQRVTSLEARVTALEGG